MVRGREHKPKREARSEQLSAAQRVDRIVASGLRNFAGLLVSALVVYSETGGPPRHTENHKIDLCVLDYGGW